VVERVVLETLPNFYLTGNLYRPQKGKAPVPSSFTPSRACPST
jgi:hypothetical protein